MALTGRYRYRLGWFGRLVLQVEQSYRAVDYGKRPQPGVDRTFEARRWRDATIEDIQPLEVPYKPPGAEA
ncbi:hypothetical protein E5S70_07275 [Ensifer adhaerens]|uniref:hypothetical protein n=1 Tax=Ensifer canadensis TaxID=555315 RepID=UPI00149074D4|nr:hypothetical protein [Ensifer canadensis]NOV15887.1 hypothetical protein [Ensifer canadensis]